MWLSGGSNKQRFFVTLCSAIVSILNPVCSQSGALGVRPFSESPWGVVLERVTSNCSRTKKTFLGKKHLRQSRHLSNALPRPSCIQLGAPGLQSAPRKRFPRCGKDLCSITGRLGLRATVPADLTLRDVLDVSGLTDRLGRHALGIGPGRDLGPRRPLRSRAHSHRDRRLDKLEEPGPDPQLRALTSQAPQPVETPLYQVGDKELRASRLGAVRLPGLPLPC